MSHKRRIVQVVSVLGVLAGSSLVSASGPAVAGPVAPAIEIQIVLGNDEVPRFKGPKAIAANGVVRVTNTTDPAQIGPHSFSFVKKSELPGREAERRKCGHFKLVCKKIAKTHGVGKQDFDAETNAVENGAVGWDRSFDNKKAKGDSHFFEAQDESAERTVTAPAGKTLYYMCIIYPRMQGKIKITD